jgi:hypothetical protein
MSKNIEKKSRSQRWFLQLLAMGFFAVSMAGLHRIEQFSGGGLTHGAAIAAYLALGAIVAMLLSTGPIFGSAGSDASALNDELTRQNRILAFKTGYAAAMACAGVILALTVWYPAISAKEAIPPVIGIGVLIAVMQFVSLENAADTDE